MNSFQPLFKKRLWLTYLFVLLLSLLKGLLILTRTVARRRRVNFLFATVSLPDPVRNLQVLFLQPQLPLGLKMQ